MVKNAPVFFFFGYCSVCMLVAPLWCDMAFPESWSFTTRKPAFIDFLNLQHVLGGKLKVRIHLCFRGVRISVKSSNNWAKLFVSSWMWPKIATCFWVPWNSISIKFGLAKRQGMMPWAHIKHSQANLYKTPGNFTLRPAGSSRRRKIWPIWQNLRDFCVLSWTFQPL